MSFISSFTLPVDLSDIANYPTILTHNQIEQTIRAGPNQVKQISFPSTNQRSFSEFYYTKVLSNGEKIKREWIVYSQKLDAVHCFCCRIFDQSTEDLSSEKGFNDWAHLSQKVKRHELSAKHLDCFSKWKSAAQRIFADKTVENQLLTQIQREKERLKEVFKRIISFVLYFAQQNIAFTGSSYALNDPTGHNGNFYQLVHTVAKFDSVLKEHLEKSNRVHYLSPKIQNELIGIIGVKVRKHILENVKKSKYFSMILDSTPDVNHSEQMTLVLRYVFFNNKTQRYEIKESFIEFLNILVKTGLGISDVALNELELLSLDANDLRGQGYDNGANMKGKNIGVQQQILQKYPRAIFSPCCDHSLNLSLNDAAAASVPTSEFFSMVHHNFVFLSGSTNRWDILKKHLGSSKIAPKAICTTRWSSRIDAMKPLRKNLYEIKAALNEIRAAEKFDHEVRHEAGCIADKMDYTFICCVCTWYDILFQINIASKALQSIQSNIETALICLENILMFLDEYEDSGFDQMIRDAKEIADRIEVEPKFRDAEKRPTKSRNLATEEDFRQNFYLFIIAVARNSVEERFESLKTLNTHFSFLYDFKSYEKHRKNGDLLKSCKQLESFLSHNGASDIDGDDLFHEFPVVATLVKKHNVVHAIDILNAINKDEIENLVPNIVIAFRIFLTVPVSVATGERSFSKLKIIKNYLRNAMLQSRLNGLAIISIENEIANSLDYDDIIEEFATAKARKMNLI